MEPYAIIQVSILLQPQRAVVANFVPGSFGLFRRNPWQPLAEPRLKNTILICHATFWVFKKCSSKRHFPTKHAYFEPKQNKDCRKATGAMKEWRNEKTASLQRNETTTSLQKKATKAVFCLGNFNHQSFDLTYCSVLANCGFWNVSLAFKSTVNCKRCSNKRFLHFMHKNLYQDLDLHRKKKFKQFFAIACNSSKAFHDLCVITLYSCCREKAVQAPQQKGQSRWITGLLFPKYHLDRFFAWFPRIVNPDPSVLGNGR